MHVKDNDPGLKGDCLHDCFHHAHRIRSVRILLDPHKERIPQALTAWMLANIHSKYVFPIVVNIFLLIVGMFIEV